MAKKWSWIGKQALNTITGSLRFSAAKTELNLMTSYLLMVPETAHR